MPVVRAGADSMLNIIVAAVWQHPRPVEWRIEPPGDDSAIWIGVSNERRPPPVQGWKLHVSASIVSAEEVLRRALPVLLAENAHFKVAASRYALDQLNQGGDGLSQIGKFITVYPNDELHAVRLAVALDAATRGLSGPAVLSDRPLRSGSLVYYRYGGFSSRQILTPVGIPAPAISAPDGALVPDVRMPYYQAPEWAVDPFVAAGVAVAQLTRPQPIGRYDVVGTLHMSPRGAVHLAFDRTTGRRCILKQARRAAMMTFDGYDARDRLRHEAAVLARLAPDPRFPEPFELVDDDDDLFLAMEFIGATTIAAAVSEIVSQGRMLSNEQIRVWGRALASVLAALHARGIIYGDLKSSNVIVAVDGQLRLVDFELAYHIGDATPHYGRGTSGYMSPQRSVGVTPTPSDDVYSLGALLYFAATGAEPALAPNPLRLLDRLPAEINPDLDPGLAAIIVRCLESDPARRFLTMDTLADALAHVGRHGASRPQVMSISIDAATPERYGQMARQLVDTLCRAGQRSLDGQGLMWPGRSGVSHRAEARGLNTGCAGVVLTLAEFVTVLGDPVHRAALAAGAQHLAQSLHPEPPLPGLYVGEAGVGTALLRAGLALGDRALITLAVQRGRSIATLPYGSPDLFHGTAGRLRFHLFLWEATNDVEHLRDATAAGDVLLTTAQDTGDGVCWTIPPGYSGLSGNVYVGYAHGAAGIADALLDLFDATGEDRFFAAAHGVARWLCRLQVPLFDDERGLAWPVIAGGPLAAPFWCHGAGGIGRFFLHAAQTGRIDGAADVAARAAWAAARGARWAGPTQCHGLAGNIEFLLDMAQTTGDDMYHQEAWSLARLLEPFGQAVYAGELENAPIHSFGALRLLTTDYMTGYAGVAACLLHLSSSHTGSSPVATS